MRKQNRPVFLIAAALFAAMLACATGSGGDDSQATLDALSAQIEGTAAASGGGEDTASLKETAAYNATLQSESAAATQAAVNALSAEQLQGTREAFGAYLAELPSYGVDPNKGRPAWIHPPLTLETDAYLSFDYGNNYLGTIVTDFVVSTEITWNTQYGTSGCGFAFRSNGNTESLDQYLAIATRGGNGRVIFSTMEDGEIINIRDIYAYGIDPNFKWRNDTTNKLTLVVRGTSIKVYTNGTLVGEFDVNDPPQRPYIPPPPPAPSDVEKEEYDAVVAQINASYQKSLALYNSNTDIAQFDKGFLIMVVAAESGKTTCNFNNTWLFLIEE